MNEFRAESESSIQIKHPGPVADTINGYQVIDCKACGFRHVLPIPTVGELTELYREDYYSREKPHCMRRQREDLDWWNLVYGDRYDLLESHLPDGPKRILDVGSGPGFFLLNGKERGWETLGLEPSRQAADHSRALGLEIIEDFLTPAVLSRLGDFSAVHLSEVLEHVPDPHSTLELARDLLRPGGLICLVVPNDYNPFQQVLTSVCGYQPWWVVPPHHINYFDFDSLQRLLGAHGFETVALESTFPIDLFLLMGENYVGNDELGRACHAKRVRFEKSLVQAGRNDLKRRLYQAFAAAGLGRDIVAVARRQDAAPNRRTGSPERTEMSC